MWRAALLLIGGMWLQMLDHGVSVILPTYAVLFVVALPLVRAPTHLLLGAAAILGMLGPLAWIALQHGQETAPQIAVLTDAPTDILRSILLSGPYPVVTWLGPFLLGMWIGRQDLNSRTLQLRLIVIGAVATVGGRILSLALIAWLGEPADAVGFDRLVTSVAHSQMPLWLISGTGTAALIVGALLRAGAFVDRCLKPLVHTGQLALTIYIAHLFVLDLLVRPAPDTLAQGVLISLAMSAGAIVFAMLWRRRFHRGPFETLLRPPWATGRRSRSNAPRRPGLRSHHPRNASQ